jgi:hypothetical protein
MQDAFARRPAADFDAASATSATSPSAPATPGKATEED